MINQVSNDPLTDWHAISRTLEPSLKETLAEAIAIIDAIGWKGFRALTMVSIPMLKKIEKGRVKHRLPSFTVRLIWMNYGLLYDPGRLESVESLLSYGKVRKESKDMEAIEVSRMDSPPAKLLEISRGMALKGL